MKRNKPIKEKTIKVYTLRELNKTMPEKQKRFVQEYVRNGWNGGKAYMTVYRTKDMNNAYARASFILRKVKIKQYMAFVKDDFELLCGISKARQIREFEKIAYCSIANVHNTWIKLKDFEKLKKNDPDIMDAIESIDSKTEQRIIDKEVVKVLYIKVKLFSKTIALEAINKLLGYNQPEKHSIKQDSTINISGGNAESIRKAFGLNNLKDPTI